MQLYTLKRIHMSSILNLLVAVLLVPGFCSQLLAQAPDLILTRGKIFTADSAHPYAEAVAIRGDRIQAVGTTAVITGLAGHHTRHIDLQGRTVIPGINDAHDHIGHSAVGGRFIAFAAPMLPGPSLQQVLDSLAVVVRQVPAGTVIRGHLGLLLIEDSSARSTALDRVAPDHPVILQAPWGHGTLVNTKAMQLLGISETESDPVGGQFERQAGTNRVSGLLKEYAETSFLRHWTMTLPDSELLAMFRTYSTEALRLGITTVQNMATALELDRTMSLLQQLKLPLRIRVIRFPGTTAHGRQLATWSRSYPTTPTLRVDGMKWIVDATPLERGALMRAAYSDKEGWSGALNWPVDTLRAILKEGLASREQLLLHVVGDATPGLVLNEMERLARAGTWRGRRVRFEHADGLLQDQWARARALGIVAVVNPSHFMFADVNHARLGADRSAHYQPLRSLLNAGIPVAIGSDGPNNPYLNIMFAALHPTNPAEAIGREQSVIAYTRGSAYAEGLEKEKGTLRPGMLADLAVLSQDIFTVPLEALPGTSSLLTIIGGKIAYNALPAKQ